MARMRKPLRGCENVPQGLPRVPPPTARSMRCSMACCRQTMSMRQLMLQAEWWQSRYYGQGSAAPPAPWDRKLTETRISTPQYRSGHGDVTHWELLLGVKRILTPTNTSIIRLRVKNSIRMREKQTTHERLTIYTQLAQRMKVCKAEWSEETKETSQYPADHEL